MQCRVRIEKTAEFPYLQTLQAQSALVAAFSGVILMCYSHPLARYRGVFTLSKGLYVAYGFHDQSSYLCVRNQYLKASRTGVHSSMYARNCSSLPSVNTQEHPDG